MLFTLVFIVEKLEVDNIFSKFTFIPWTSEPILGLFVLIWMHFLCWIKYDNKNFNLQFCNFENFVLSSAVYYMVRMRRVKFPFQSCQKHKLSITEVVQTSVLVYICLVEI